VLGILGLIRGFFFLIDERIAITNDTSSSVEVAWLLQNHDDSKFYLSKTFTIKSGEYINESVGFESVRCIYFQSEEGSFSGTIKNSNDSRTIEVSVASVKEEGDSCSVMKEQFQEGIGNRMQLNNVR
jgi:hypothetical protein